MFSAFLDTCVLVPSLSRDVLLEVAEQSVYRPLWSSEVLEELERTVRRLTAQRGVAPDVVDSYVGKIARPDEPGLPRRTGRRVEPLVETITLPDATDRHVVAAALSGRADVIVTENQKDFPPEQLPVPMSSQTADTFLLDSLDLHPSAVLAAVRAVAMRTGRNGPPRSSTEIATLLRDRQCPGFGAALLPALSGDW